MNGNGDKPIIHDLDILRPAPEYVKLAGKEIDISFIPSGIAIDIENIQEKMNKLTDTPAKMKKIAGGGKEAAQSFDIAAELCAKITSSQHEEMDKEWLLKNTDIFQIKALMEYVISATTKSFESIEDEDSKKQQAVKTESH